MIIVCGVTICVCFDIYKIVL